MLTITLTEDTSPLAVAAYRAIESEAKATAKATEATNAAVLPLVLALDYLSVTPVGTYELTEAGKARGIQSALARAIVPNTYGKGSKAITFVAHGNGSAAYLADMAAGNAPDATPEAIARRDYLRAINNAQVAVSRALALGKPAAPKATRKARTPDVPTSGNPIPGLVGQESGTPARTQTPDAPKAPAPPKAPSDYVAAIAALPDAQAHAALARLAGLLINRPGSTDAGLLELGRYARAQRSIRTAATANATDVAA